MEPVHREDHIESSVAEGKRPHVTLHQPDISDPRFRETLLRLREHIGAIVQADDVRGVHPGVFRGREDAGPDRDVQQPAGEIIRDIGKHFPRDGVVIHPAPEDIHIEPAPPGGAGQDVVVDVPGLPVGVPDPVSPLPGKPRPGAVHPLAVGFVLGTEAVAKPFLLRQAHHQGHQPPEDERQHQQPEVAGEQGRADANEHPAHIEGVAHPRIDTVRAKTVILDGIVDLVKEEGIAPDEGTQQDGQDAEDKHGDFQCRDDSAGQVSSGGQDHSKGGKNGNDGWYKSVVEIKPAKGYEISLGNRNNFSSEPIKISDSLKGGSIYLRDAIKGGQSAAILLGNILIDTKAPTVNNVSEDNICYGDKDGNINITVSDENFSHVEVNGRKISIKDEGEGKYSFSLTAGKKKENVDFSVYDLAGNKTESSVITAPGWSKDGVVVEGELYLEKGEKYTLPEGKWKINGDNTVYAGGSVFYAQNEGLYIFTKVE